MAWLRDGRLRRIRQRVRMCRRCICHFRCGHVAPKRWHVARRCTQGWCGAGGCHPTGPRCSLVGHRGRHIGIGRHASHGRRRLGNNCRRSGPAQVVASPVHGSRGRAPRPRHDHCIGASGNRLRRAGCRECRVGRTWRSRAQLTHYRRDWRGRSGPHNWPSCKLIAGLLAPLGKVLRMCLCRTEHLCHSRHSSGGGSAGALDQRG
mmetsp:Transcript_35794/g.76336  ORF Transcript_35794/g.76336 Transcript_35794/m.76336 type:complete len:205 (+) Transcript_35794:1061-1675(+)